MPDAQSRRRVLIAAYLLPKTIEFQSDEAHEADESATKRTYSPPTQHGTSHTEQLAHQLTSSLMEAIDKEQARSRVLAGRPGRVSTAMSSSPRQALSAPRDRVNMAELMADAAAGTKPSYLQRSSSSITSYEVDREQRHSDNALLEVKSSLSDHGRRASAQSELGTSQATPPRSMPPPVSSASSTSPLPIPISIISDLEAKSHQGTATAPTPKENPYGLGSSTPVPPVRSSAVSSSTTPRLMEHPHLAPGWTDGIEAIHTSSAPNAAPRPRGPTPASTEGAVRDEERRTSTVWRFNIARPALRSRSKRFSSSQQRIPFEFLPNPGANHGLFNAVNSAGTQVASRSVYVGTLGIEMDWLSTHMRAEIDAKAMDQHKCVPVWLKDDEYVHCYHHYCKQILWPAFHYTQPSAQALETEHDAFHAYVKVNQSFADRIVAEYREGDVIWIHDYHLLLVPAMVRAVLPRAPIGLFVHIAFPSSEIFRCLSRREELLRGMLGADLIGFQTHNFFQHFRQTVSRILQLPTTSRGIVLQRSFVTVAPFPIGIDVRVLNQRRQHPDVREWVAKLKERFAGMRVIVGRDKLDWIKGVREKLLAFELFLDQHPEWVGRVVLVQVALATVQENHEVGDVSDIVSRINRKHSSLTYQPVVFLHVNEITFSQYLALLTMADAFVATSLREGMNLTSHEYVIAQEERKRPLILSEFTGAYSALRACIGINPFHAQQVAQAIERALTMDEDEMAQRWTDLHRTVVSQTAEHWVLSVLSQLERAHLSQPSPNTMFTPRLEIGQMQAEWRVAGTRLVLLSLEHTLVWEDAKQLHEHGFEPPAELVGVLRRLTADPRNYVYVLSRKSTTDLDQLARAVPALGIIAENGCYAQHCTRAPDGACEWMSLVDGIDMKWREPVRNILDYFTERTPGAWIEERSTTITWYFCEGTTNQQDVAWARRQASEVQSLITDSLGERFSLRMINENTHFVIMPKNVGFTPAVQYMLALDNMGSLPVRQGTPGKALFEFVLYIGHDEKLLSHLNHVDLPFAPRTCTTARPDTIAGSIASCQLEPGKQVLDALEEIVDVHLRDLKWGGPAMMDV